MRGSFVKKCVAALGIFAIFGQLALAPAVAGDLLVSQMKAKGIVSGTFAEADKSAPISRGEFLRMCLVAASLTGGAATNSGASPFVDLAPGDGNRGYYNVAYVYGLVAGYTDRTLRAERPLRRMEAAAFMLRLRHIMMPFADPTAEQVAFLDEATMAFAVRENARQAVALGYMRRDDGVNFAPQRLVTYGEAMQMLQAFMLANGHFYDFSGRVTALARDGQFADIADSYSGLTMGVGISLKTIVTNPAGDDAKRFFRIGDAVRGMLDAEGNLTLVEIINAQE